MYECACVSICFLSFSQFSIVLQERSAVDCLIWFHPSVSVFGEGSFLLRVYEEREMIVPGSESKPEKKGLGKCRRRNRFTRRRMDLGVCWLRAANIYVKGAQSLYIICIQACLCSC